MIIKGIKETRQELSKLIKNVQGGEEIIVTLRGEPVARISPIQKGSGPRIGSRKELREKIKISGKPLSQTIIEDRDRFV
jgi:prevent-host-death family protein